MTIRNRTSDADGKYVYDVELVDGDPPKAVDHLTGKERPATPDEKGQLRERQRINRLVALRALLKAQDLTAAQVSEMLRLERGL